MLLTLLVERVAHIGTVMYVVELVLLVHIALVVPMYLNVTTFKRQSQFSISEKIEPSFPQYLLTARNDGKIKPLSPASMKKACGEARRFFSWARLNKPDYRKVSEAWVETIQPSRASGTQSELKEREFYSLVEIRKLVDFVPERLIDKRDRAGVALMFLSSIRIGAFVTLPIDCVDIPDLTIYQLPNKGVEVKNSKAQKTYLLPIDDLLAIVIEWDQLVKVALSESDFWYPNLSTDGMEWSVEDHGNSESRRMAFSRGLSRLCERGGIEYKSPHKIRHGFGAYAVKHAKDYEQFKAYSKNMGMRLWLSQTNFMGGLPIMT